MTPLPTEIVGSPEGIVRETKAGILLITDHVRRSLEILDGKRAVRRLHRLWHPSRLREHIGVCGSARATWRRTREHDALRSPEPTAHGCLSSCRESELRDSAPVVEVTEPRARRTVTVLNDATCRRTAAASEHARRVVRLPASRPVSAHGGGLGPVDGAPTDEDALVGARRAGDARHSVHCRDGRGSQDLPLVAGRATGKHEHPRGRHRAGDHNPDHTDGERSGPHRWERYFALSSLHLRTSESNPGRRR